jgi:hypothetical protein
MEFSRDCPKELFAVKSTRTALIDLDLFVERRSPEYRR